MSHGTSLITRKETLEEEKRKLLLEHEFFVLKDIKYQSNHFIRPHVKPTAYEKILLDLLADLGVYYEDKAVEYWFQYQSTDPNHPLRNNLSPHCDFNCIMMEKNQGLSPDWPHHTDPSLILSPITIAIYLDVDNIEGGELGISRRTWKEFYTPFAAPDHEVKKDCEYYAPTTGDIVFFHGSEHFHWIEPLRKGERKSLLMNFWPKDIGEAA